MQDQMNIGCPLCGGALEEVRNPSGSMLNDEQFASFRAGDFYCEKCKGTEARSGYKYFWKSDLTREGRQKLSAAKEPTHAG